MNRATTEPVLLPGGGWKYVPIGGGFTPGIIDHYPEGPGETRPFEPPLSWGGFDGGIVPPIIQPGTSFQNGPYLRRNEMPMNPGSLNIPIVGGGGPSVLATALLGAGGVLAGKHLGNLFNR
jgi:hypothetical protein